MVNTFFPTVSWLNNTRQQTGHLLSEEIFVIMDCDYKHIHNNI
jgi:hypothetical protein